MRRDAATAVRRIALWATMTVVLAWVGPACGLRWTDRHGGSTWPLRGAHIALACADCHTGAAHLPTTCQGCHEADRPVPHFAGECAECHDEEGWGTFAHDFFPLEQAHAVACTACHVNGTYEGLVPTCSSCHETDRPAEHFAGQDCGGACHPATSWADGHFDHQPLFPVPHRGVSACNDCHLGGDVSDFSCIHCHEHRQSEADEEHREVRDYTYDNDACLHCHPNGQSD